jgi:steroid Delta-isomerase
VDEWLRTFLGERTRRFNDAVESGDFAPLVELFTDDAELAFVGVPAGPFAGREAIAAAYAAQPPDDGLDVLETREDPDGTVVERFAWRRGGGGEMRLSLRDGKIARLVVVFDA